MFGTARIVSTRNRSGGFPARPEITHRLSTQGFTLIELLVVTMVTAMLLALLVPAVSRAVRQARTAVCGVRLRTCGQALFYYVEANRDAMCWGGDRYTVNTWELLHRYIQRSTPSRFGDWDKAPLINEYQGDDRNALVYEVEFYLCPSDTFYHHTSQTPDRSGRGVLYPLSYCTNYFLFMTGKRPDGTMEGPRKASSIRRPSDMALATEQGDDSNNHGGRWELKDFNYPDPAVRDPNQREFQVRHCGGGLVLYLDGHVRLHRLVPDPPQYGLPPFPPAIIPNWKSMALGGNGDLDNWVRPAPSAEP